MTNKELTLFFVWCWLKASKRVEKCKVACKSWHQRHKKEQKVYRKEYRHGSGRPKWLTSSRQTDAARRECGTKSAYQTQYLRGIRKTNPNYALAEGIRNRINQALKRNYKATSTVQLLGCSIAQLKTHLEKLFLPGMNWHNRGKLWHVDHIKPCAEFDLSNSCEQKRCFHYTNLQPLWAEDNLQKGAKWTPSHKE